MSSLLVLVLTALLFCATARPRDRLSHKGLYDDLKTVPFVDNGEETRGQYGDYLNDLTKPNSTYDLHDKFESLYKKYNQKLNRDTGIGEGDNLFDRNEDSRKDVDGSQGGLPIVNEIKPVEGGLEDMTKFEDNTEDNSFTKRGGRKRRRNKKGKGHKHKQSVKKDLSLKEDEEAEEKDDNDADDLGFNMEKFYRENPNFKKNVATITDHDKHETTTEKNMVTGVNDLSESEDDVDEMAKDMMDVDDDADDDEEDGVDSVSADKSSEGNDYYDYYDEDDDSSYSSSEQAAEAERHDLTPADWFKHFDKPQMDDYHAHVDPTTTPADDDIKKNDFKSETIMEYDIKTNTIGKLKEGETDNNKDNIPKTDVEPSTSPNPPTPQKGVKSTVTQPAYSHWNERVNTWNLIESKPVASCQEATDCQSGRMCRYGLCLCGQPDFCEGRSKPVCGSDGRRYPSHCELHRTACVLGIHIRIDQGGSCFQNNEKMQADMVADSPRDERQAPEKSTEIPSQISKTNTPVVVEHMSRGDKNEDQAAGTLEDNRTDRKTDAVEDVVETAVVTKAVDNVVVQDNSNMASVHDKSDYNDSSSDTEEYKYDDSYDYDDIYDHDSDEDLNNNGNKFGDVAYRFDDNSKHDTDDIDDSYYDLSDEYADDYDDVSLSKDNSERQDSEESPSLVPLFCTPDLFMQFKADVMQYHCVFFEEKHCNKLNQEEKQRLAAIMFNYYDKDFSGQIEKEELWEMQMVEHIDDLSSMCTLLDIIMFNELGERDGKLNADEFIQAFDIPDLVSWETEVVPLLATIGNGLEVKCDVTDSSDVVWTRDGLDLAVLNYPGITVLGDGSLYLETIGFHVVGNLTCYDRKKPAIKQIHMLTVQKPPHVQVHTRSTEVRHGRDLVIQCHAEGFPRPAVTWKFDGNNIQNGQKYHVHSFDDSLTVYSADYTRDTGVYTCEGRNTAGTAEASEAISVHNPNNTANTEASNEESFIIFHDDGYTMHEPTECLTQRHVKPEFANFHFLPDDLDAPPSMCEPGIPCVWGSAVSVGDEFVYITQPRQNRVLVIDVKQTLNPNQVIYTDHMPVSVHYVASQDEVWVLCWNGEQDGGSKTLVVIRDARQRNQHHAIHTQPIGNTFDLVQGVFLPEDTELHHPYHYGYTVHNGQQGLFKIDLEFKKYERAVDFSKFECVPTNIAFVPLGGHALVQCVRQTVDIEVTSLLTLDTVTDTVIHNITSPAAPYVSPDVSFVVFVEERTGNIDVHLVNENGEIVHQFDVALGTPVGKATFHRASHHHGYDIYLTARDKPVIFSVSLSNGQIETITDIGEADSELYLPWFNNLRPLVSGGVFSDFLSTTGESAMLVLNGKKHAVQCHYKDLQNPSVIVYTHLTT